MQEKDRILLVDVNSLKPIGKIVPPTDQQLPNESQRFWQGVTTSILSKEFNQATNVKQEIEERQRAKAAERKANNTQWHPRFFTAATEPPGRPQLTAEGRAALDKLHHNDWQLDPAKEYGAF